MLGEIRYGIAIEPEVVLVIEESQRKQLIHEDPRCKNLILPYVDGEVIGRYHVLIPEKSLYFHPAGLD